MKFSTLFTTLLIAAGALATGGIALAGDGARAARQAQATATDQAELTLAQATTIAEVKLGGRVVGGRLHHGDAAGKVYRLDLAGADGPPRRGEIAAAGGEVLSSTVRGGERAARRHE
jgi:uncharacterized membrane protein YkoI